jgi:hypothetical protein
MQRSADEWMQTFTGGKFWPLDPRPEEIRLADIAHHLAILRRWTGATRIGYSIAEHSVRVSLLAEQLARQNTPTDLVRIRLAARAGLMHDASEAYLNDVASPIKRTKTFVEYRKAERHLQDMINAVFGLDPYPPEVRAADLQMLANEAYELLPNGPTEDWAAKYGQPITLNDSLGWDDAYAEGQFLRRFASLAFAVSQ